MSQYRLTDRAKFILVWLGVFAYAGLAWLLVLGLVHIGFIRY